MPHHISPWHENSAQTRYIGVTHVVKPKQNGRHFTHDIFNCLKSPASRLFTQPFIQAQIKENIKAPRHRPLCGEFTGSRWFPRKGASYAKNVSIWWRHHELWHNLLMHVFLTRWVDKQLLFGGECLLTVVVKVGGGGLCVCDFDRVVIINVADLRCIINTSHSLLLHSSVPYIITESLYRIDLYFENREQTSVRFEPEHEKRFFHKYTSGVVIKISAVFVRSRYLTRTYSLQHRVLWHIIKHAFDNVHLIPYKHAHGYIVHFLE